MKKEIQDAFETFIKKIINLKGFGKDIKNLEMAAGELGALLGFKIDWDGVPITIDSADFESISCFNLGSINQLIAKMKQDLAEKDITNPNIPVLKVSLSQLLDTLCQKVRIYNKEPKEIVRTTHSSIQDIPESPPSEAGPSSPAVSPSPGALIRYSQQQVFSLMQLPVIENPLARISRKKGLAFFNIIPDHLWDSVFNLLVENPIAGEASEGLRYPDQTKSVVDPIISAYTSSTVEMIVRPSDSIVEEIKKLTPLERRLCLSKITDAIASDRMSTDPKRNSKSNAWLQALIIAGHAPAADRLEEYFNRKIQDENNQVISNDPEKETQRKTELEGQKNYWNCVAFVASGGSDFKTGFDGAKGILDAYHATLLKKPPTEEDPRVVSTQVVPYSGNSKKSKEVEGEIVKIAGHILSYIAHSERQQTFVGNARAILKEEALSEAAKHLERTGTIDFSFIRKALAYHIHRCASGDIEKFNQLMMNKDTAESGKIMAQVMLEFALEIGDCTEKPTSNDKQALSQYRNLGHIGYSIVLQAIRMAGYVDTFEAQSVSSVVATSGQSKTARTPEENQYSVSKISQLCLAMKNYKRELTDESHLLSPSTP